MLTTFCYLRQVVGRWFSEWDPRLQLNVSKIIWSAKDQAAVMAAKKMKHSTHMSSSYFGKSEYANNNHKGPFITIEGEDKTPLTNGGTAVEDLDSFDRRIDVGTHHRNSVRDDNTQFKKMQDETFTFTSRIPISVCALPCKVGEKKVMSTVRSK